MVENIVAICVGVAAGAVPNGGIIDVDHMNFACEDLSGAMVATHHVARRITLPTT